jgi:uncharacterized protein YjiS (DUF1127 family)
MSPLLHPFVPTLVLATGPIASTLARAGGRAWRRVRTHWQAWRRRAATRRALERLDAAALRDIGLTPAEIGSTVAELHDARIATRLIVIGSHPIDLDCR